MEPQNKSKEITEAGKDTQFKQKHTKCISPTRNLLNISKSQFKINSLDHNFTYNVNIFRQFYDSKSIYFSVESLSLNFSKVVVSFNFRDRLDIYKSGYIVSLMEFNFSVC